MLSARRSKGRASHEEHLIVHQDWSDCRTELLPGARKGGDATPQARIFGDESGNWKSPNKLEAVSHDNSQKIKYSDGMNTQQLHQGHLKATMQSDDFYAKASNIKEWEVIELHIAGLPHDADDTPFHGQGRGGTAPPPSPREGEAKAAKEKGGILKLQHIFEKYGGSGPAIPPKLAAILGPRSQGDLCRSQPSRLRHVECIVQSESTGSSALKPEILELTCEVPGAIVTPYGVGVRESQDDEGFVHVKFPWGTAAVAVKDTDDSRSAVLRWVKLW
eukprot:symbB.v1.2.019157.t1/scaffold1555.1/size186957/11